MFPIKEGFNPNKENGKQIELDLARLVETAYNKVSVYAQSHGKTTAYGEEVSYPQKYADATSAKFETTINRLYGSVETTKIICNQKNVVAERISSKALIRQTPYKKSYSNETRIILYRKNRSVINYTYNFNQEEAISTREFWITINKNVYIFKFQTGKPPFIRGILTEKDRNDIMKFIASYSEPEKMTG